MDYRGKALEQLQQADQLDALMRVVRPKAWLAAGAFTLLVGGLLAWGLLGELPQRVEAPGVLTREAGVIEQQSLVAGQVRRVAVEVGDDVTVGEPLAEVVAPNGRPLVIEAAFAGRVLDVGVAPGRVINPGGEVVDLDPGAGADAGLLALAFVPPQQGAGLQPGMEVDVDVSSAPSSDFGFVRGRVASVTERPLSVGAITELVGNDATARAFSQSGPLVAVRIALDRDADTASGLRWTSSDGADRELTVGTIVTANVIRRRPSPADLVFGDS